MEWMELQKRIVNLAETCNVEVDRMDISITLTVAMTPLQVDDLAAMMAFLLREETPSAALSNTIHDLGGLKAIHLKDPHGDCFVPRSAGYAAKMVN